MISFRARLPTLFKYTCNVHWCRVTHFAAVRKERQIYFRRTPVIIDQMGAFEPLANDDVTDVLARAPYYAYVVRSSERVIMSIWTMMSLSMDDVP